jgi:glycosyltransferase involved in cell wall biosynthesis
MKILLLTPGINKKTNDNYHAYKYIAENGHMILAISNVENILKGAEAEFSPEAEHDRNISIYRVFETLKEQRTCYLAMRKYGVIKNIVKKFNPDIIFCENSINMPLAVKLKKDFHIPIVLRLEFLFDWDNPCDIIGHQKFIKNKITGDIFGKIAGFLFWKWLCHHSDGIISHYPGDQKKVVELLRRGKQAVYIPWPGKEPVFKEKTIRHQDRAIFIGSFDVHKNFNEFKKVLPELFSKTPVKEFYFVGSGHYLYIVDELRRLFPHKIKHISTMSREDCLKLISSCYFCYSPAVSGGWGFIGDAWAMKTPFVAACNHYNFNDGIDSIVADADAITGRVNSLYNDRGFYEKIAAGGYERFKNNHSAEKAGQKYLDVCFKALNPVFKKPIQE